MTIRLAFLNILLGLFVSGSLAQDTDFEAGATPYTPQQLQELLAGQNKMSVINFFGRMPNHQQGHDWIYNRLLIAVPTRDQYYTTAVV